MSWPFGSADIDTREANLNKSLISIEAYLNQIDAWALSKFGQKAYWLRHQTFASNVRMILSSGLRGGGAGLQSTTLVGGPDRIIEALRGMGEYKIYSGGKGFAHRGSDGLIVIMVTGRSVVLKPGQNPNIVFRAFLEDEGINDTLPPKYIMGGFFVQDDGAVKLLQNPAFVG